MPERTIFRQSTLAAYERGVERDVVPRLTSWPIIVCLWLLLGVLLTTGLLAWNVRVPIYTEGAGILLAAADVLPHAGGDTGAVVFLSPDQAAHVRVGLPVDVEIGPAGAHHRGTIEKIAPGIMSPTAARGRYRLDGAAALLVTQPSVVVIVRLDAALPAAAYAGSIVTARLETGSQRLLALLPGLGKLLGNHS